MIPLCYSKHEKPLKRFFFIIIITLGLLLIYNYFFSYTTHCSASDAWMHLDQTSNWRILQHSLNNAINEELYRRNCIGATSTHVTLSDIGVAFKHGDTTGFERYPGLASLHATHPSWFANQGRTTVSVLVSNMVSSQLV